MKNLPVDKAGEFASSDPDYSIRDLYNAIAKGDYPTWTLFIQIMTLEQAKTYKYNPFDLTKVIVMNINDDRCDVAASSSQFHSFS